MRKIFLFLDKLFRATGCGLRSFYYKIILGWGVSIGGPIKICGSVKNIIIKGKAGINAFCILGARDDARIIIHNNVSISPGCILIPYGLDVNVLDQKRPHQSYGDIVLEENCWLGTGSIVIGGVRVGRNSVVGAGAVVTKDVPDNCVVKGIPAKVDKWLGGGSQLSIKNEKSSG